MQYFRCGLASAVLGGMIISFDLLATLLFIQPSVVLAIFASRAHCSLMYSSLPTKTCKDFSTELCGCPGLFLPRCRTSQLFLLNFMLFLLALSSCLPT